MSNNIKSNKKRKHSEFHTNNNNHNSPMLSPPKKRAKISKRSSKKPKPAPINSPNSHITITFANIHNTIDAITLPKANVLAITNAVLTENKHKLSIKKSDPIQNEIAPEIPIDIQTLQTPNIKTIHSKNLFRMGTSLFYCSDENRLFWAFPLRKTRRVACQHYCCAVNKIVTRTIGIHSNACNGSHPQSTSCVYAICNGKPSKSSIPAKLLANYQYFQHATHAQILVLKDNITQQKFKNVSNSCDGPPPLMPLKDGSVKPREYFTDYGEPVPFQENVQINLKALNNYKQLLVSSSDSYECDVEETENMKKCKTLMLNGQFNEAIILLKVWMDREDDNDILNEYRILMASCLYYKQKKALALHFVELVLANCKDKIQCYETRKLRGLINKDLNNYKAACYDFEYICHNNPYVDQWTDKLYGKPRINCNIWQNNNNYSQQPVPAPAPLPPDLTLDILGSMVFVPPIMDRNNYKSNGMNLGNMNRLLPAQTLERETTRDLLLDKHSLMIERCMSLNISNDESNDLSTTNMTSFTSMDRTVSSTPQPLDKIRSDAFIN